MFNNLANYLLGGSNQAETTRQTEEEEKAAAANRANNIRLTSVVLSDLDESNDEDDWVLVDRDSEGNSEESSEESDCEPNVTEGDSLETLLVRRRSSNSTNTNRRLMEESWFLTPPPCFVSSGPIHMETSPLENLLIEHPSMSVYQQPVLVRRSLGGLNNNSSGYESDADEVVVGFREEEEDFTAIEEIETVARTLPRTHNRALLCAEVIVQRGKQGTKHAQKAQIQKTCKSFKRGHLERNNKAREVNYRNQRLRRSARSQGATRSHANNNRKC